MWWGNYEIQSFSLPSDDAIKDSVGVAWHHPTGSLLAIQSFAIICSLIALLSMMRVRIHRTGKIADNYARKAAVENSKQKLISKNPHKILQNSCLILKHQKTLNRHQKWEIVHCKLRHWKCWLWVNSNHTRQKPFLWSTDIHLQAILNLFIACIFIACNCCSSSTSTSWIDA